MNEGLDPAVDPVTDLPASDAQEAPAVPEVPVSAEPFSADSVGANTPAPEIRNEYTAPAETQPAQNAYPAAPEAQQPAYAPEAQQTYAPPQQQTYQPPQQTYQPPQQPSPYTVPQPQTAYPYPADGGRASEPRSSEPRPGKKSPYAPMTSVGMAIQLILMGIPVVGLVLMILWSCGVCRKIARRNLARASLILLILGIILSVAAAVVIRFVFPEELTRAFEQAFPGYTIKWN